MEVEANTKDGLQLHASALNARQLFRERRKVKRQEAAQKRNHRPTPYHSPPVKSPPRGPRQVGIRSPGLSPATSNIPQEPRADNARSKRDLLETTSLPTTNIHPSRVQNIHHAKPAPANPQPEVVPATHKDIPLPQTRETRPPNPSFSAQSPKSQPEPTAPPRPTFYAQPSESKPAPRTSSKSTAPARPPNLPPKPKPLSPNPTFEAQSPKSQPKPAISSKTTFHAVTSESQPAPTVFPKPTVPAQTPNIQPSPTSLPQKPNLTAPPPEQQQDTTSPPTSSAPPPEEKKALPSTLELPKPFSFFDDIEDSTNDTNDSISEVQKQADNWREISEQKSKQISHYEELFELQKRNMAAKDREIAALRANLATAQEKNRGWEARQSVKDMAKD